MKKLNFFVKNSYGVGNLAYSVISQNVTNFYMFFGTAVLGVSGFLVGLAISIATMWDGLSDCIVGGISDRFKIGKLGYRNGYMLIATIGMAVINVLIWFAPLNAPQILKFIWIGVGLLILETFNTLFSTPYMALGNDIATDSHDKTSIQIYKTMFFILGIAIPSVLMYLFLPNTESYPIGQLNPYGYRKISLILSGICLIAGLFCTFSTLKYVDKNSTTDQKQDKFSFKKLIVDFYSSFKNKNLRYLIIGFALSQITPTVLTGAGMHFFTYCFLYSTKQITILLSILMLGTLVSQPVWFHLSKKNGKCSTMISGIFVSILGAFLIMFSYFLRFKLLEYSYILAIISIFICGFGSGTLYALPISLFGDEIDKINKETRSNKTATYSGNLTFSANIANATALLFIGVLLDLIHFDSSVEIQPLSVQSGLAIILFIGVIIPFLLSTLFFYKYKVATTSQHLTNPNLIKKDTLNNHKD